METPVSERIKFLVTSREKGNKSAFGRTIGVTPQAVADILETKGGPSFPVLQKILKAYPDINSEWLIFGEGEMLKGQQPEEAGLTSGEATVEHAQELASNSALRELVESQRQQIATLTKMLDWVRGLVPSALGKLMSNLEAAHGIRIPYSYGSGVMAGAVG